LTPTLRATSASLFDMAAILRKSLHYRASPCTPTLRAIHREGTLRRRENTGALFSRRPVVLSAARRSRAVRNARGAAGVGYGDEYFCAPGPVRPRSRAGAHGTDQRA